MDDSDAEALSAELATLRAEVAELRQQLVGKPSDPGADLTPPAPGPRASVGRRQALRTGLAVAGAAVAGAVLLDGQPAAAANGSNLILGSANQSASAVTAFAVTGNSTQTGFGVVDNSIASNAYYRHPAILAHAKGYGYNFDTGLLVVAEQVSSGVAVTAASGNAAVLSNNSQYNATILATNINGAGRAITALSPGTAIDAQGLSIGGIGVQADAQSGTAIVATGKNGARIEASNYHLQLAPTRRSAPTLDTTNHDRGEFVVDTDGQLWFCIAGGTPGVWRQLSGLGSAGSLFVLPSPRRVYDSRPGTAPTAVGPKTPLVPNVARTIDLKANASTIPPGATAALVTVLVVGTAAGNGNLTVWANGVARPTANTMVWGGASGGRYTAKELTATDAQSRIQVSSSLKTDVVIDVVGYYR